MIMKVKESKLTAENLQESEKPQSPKTSLGIIYI